MLNLLHFCLLNLSIRNLKWSYLRFTYKFCVILCKNFFFIKVVLNLNQFYRHLDLSCNIIALILQGMLRNWQAFLKIRLIVRVYWLFLILRAPLRGCTANLRLILANKRRCVMRWVGRWVCLLFTVFTIRNILFVRKNVEVSWLLLLRIIYLFLNIIKNMCLWRL